MALLHTLTLKPPAGTFDHICINYDMMLHFWPNQRVVLTSGVRKRPVSSLIPRGVSPSRGCVMAGAIAVRGLRENFGPCQSRLKGLGFP